MKRVYLDNGSTSFPKAPGVSQVMQNFTDNIGINVNRGGYADAYEAEDVIFETREKLCKLFGWNKPKNVIFTANITESLNCLIKGFLKPGDHVLVSSVEHNAMMRPLTQVSKRGVEFDRIPCDREGRLELQAVEGLLRPSTKAIFMTHASNVSGTLMPIELVGEICSKHGIKFVVDAAQTAGAFPIDMKAMHIDALAFTGHKSLLGPQGIGGFIISDEMAKEVEPLIAGGTGSASDSEEQPEFLPDKFESGTMNIPGIYGLSAALDYLLKQNIQTILQDEMKLTEYFINEMNKLADVRVVGPKELEERAPVVSLDFLGKDNGEIAFLLDSNYGISTRCGLHCAPNTHKTLGTYPQGTIRFAFGHKNTMEEASYAVNAVKEIVWKK